jgi:hypothetical protein
LPHSDRIQISKSVTSGEIILRADGNTLIGGKPNGLTLGMEIGIDPMHCVRRDRCAVNLSELERPEAAAHEKPMSLATCCRGCWSVRSGEQSMVAVGGAGSANGRSSRTKNHKRLVTTMPLARTGAVVSSSWICCHNMKPTMGSAPDGHARCHALVKSTTKRALTTRSAEEDARTSIG